MILDDYEATSDLAALPLSSVDDDVVINDIKNNSEYDYECEIIRHDTSLDDTSYMSDMVEVSVTFDSELVHSEGTLVCYYAFNGLEWELTELEKNPAYFNESLNVDGTWICELAPTYSSRWYYVLQLWHGDDGEVYANWYDCKYRENENTIIGYEEGEHCRFSFKEGKLFVENTALYFELDYDNIYTDNATGKIPFERISDDILSNEEFKQYIGQ